MGFSLTPAQADAVLSALKQDYRVYAPKRFPKQGRYSDTDVIRYAEVERFSDIVWDVKSDYPAKEVITPIQQAIFYFTEDEYRSSKVKEKPILILARPCDINAQHIQAKIYAGNGGFTDLYYERVRERVKFAMMECNGGDDTCFCVSMGTNVCGDYSAAVRIDDICALVEVLDEDLLPYFQDEVPIAFTPQFVRVNRRAAHLPTIRDRKELERACKLDFWRQYDDACIACGTCNTVCPTCSCFDTVDVIYHETSSDGERRRVWSACMLADFTETAGGGLARKTQGDNMRFKVLHKVYDYQLRFGGEGQMCVGCGRCIDRCPREIDYLDAVNGLTAALSGREEG